MSLKSWMEFLGVPYWGDDDADNELPALGAGDGYVVTLDDNGTRRKAVWRPGSSVRGHYQPMGIGNPDDPDFPGIVFTYDGQPMMVWVED